MTTDFLQGLDEADIDAKPTRVAQNFMRIKGYPEIKPLGMVEVNETCWYYYYELPEGILELEVLFREDTRKFTRGVSSLIDNTEKVARMLGRRRNPS
jgi:hypothetical protein